TFAISSYAPSNATHLAGEPFNPNRSLGRGGISLRLPAIGPPWRSPPSSPENGGGCALASLARRSAPDAASLRSSSDVAEPAIDVDRRAGEVGTGIGSEEQNHAGELLRRANPPQGNAPCHFGVEFRQRAALILLGMPPHPLVALDAPDQHRIDQHVVGRALAGPRLGQRHAGGPGHRSRGAGGSRRLGADVQDVDYSPPATCLHARKRQAA